MHRHVPALVGITLFSFFGLFDQNEEYGDLTGALKRTMAQALPPYHQTADTAQIQRDSGTPPGPTDPGRGNPPASAERTPNPVSAAPVP